MTKVISTEQVMIDMKDAFRNNKFMNRQRSLREKVEQGKNSISIDLNIWCSNKGRKKYRIQ